ncbi:hypothetical protein BVI2075_370066 [Burkholderia vietnamiensis]|nr:hypothetical protein BVI2075_370066 [Burkholderia vietnamiensis]
MRRPGAAARAARAAAGGRALGASDRRRGTGCGARREAGDRSGGAVGGAAVIGARFDVSMARAAVRRFGWAMGARLFR